MCSLPKLLPSWHDLSYQDIVRQKRFYLYAPLQPPDYGGVGVDLNLTRDVNCSVLKYSQSQIRFASEKCALPLMPLRQIDDYDEPCLESLKKEKFEFDKFSLSLTFLRDVSKFPSNKEFYQKLKNIQQDIHDAQNYGQEREVNMAVPKSIVQLAETIPKRVVVPAYNVAYAGGTLSAYKSFDKQYFIHPSCKNSKKLCITPLLNGSDQHFTPNYSEQTTIKLKDEPILQVDQALDGVCVRQKNTFHLVNLSNMDKHSKTVSDSELYHIAANPYNPTEILSIYEKGVMKLRDMATKCSVWSMSEDVYADRYLFYPTWRCGFGSHPFSAMCLNERKLYSFDFREKNKSPRIIFDIENPSFYVGEELVCLKQWNKNPFQHFLTSTHHLVLCDERYCKTPMMTWNHCLKNHPVYIDCVDFDSDVSIIVIATQKSPQLAAFLCSGQANIQPVSLSSPLLLSSPSDCINSLKFHCYYIEDKLSSRFSAPLTGVSVIPHVSKIGFTVFQSTSLGDIFYQDFKQCSESIERTYCVSTGCTLTPPEKILPHINKLLSNSVSSRVHKETDEALTRIEINIDKVLSPPKEISANCMLCRLSSSASEKELVISDICPTCNLSSAESHNFSKAMANESVLIGPVSEESGFLDCDIDYLSKFDDKYSKRILSVWLDPSDVSKFSII